MLSRQVEELEEKKDELTLLLADINELATKARSNPKSVVELTETLNKIIKMTEEYHIPF